MASMVSFKQLCPSCEHPVPIRDPKLIGKKIDCPKCKYRFVVEEPAAEGGDDEEAGDSKKKGGKGDKNGAAAVTAKKPATGKAAAAAAPAKKPGRRRDDDDDVDDSAPKKKKGSTSPILFIGIGLAVVAVIGLGIALVLMLGDDEPKKGTGGSGAAVTPPPAPEKKDENAGQKLVGEGDGGDTSAATNLLPNDTEVVRDAKIDKLIQSTLGDETAFNKNTDSFRKEAFEAKFGFPLDNIARHVQGQSVKQDWIFNVIRTKKAIDWDKLKTGLALQKGPKSPIEGKEYFEITADLDPFSRFWLSDMYMFTDPTRSKPLGVYKSDEQTLVIAEMDPLEKFLQKRPVLADLPGESAPPAGGGGAPGTGGGMAPGGSGGGGLKPMTPSAGGGAPGSGGAPPGSGGGLTPMTPSAGGGAPGSGGAPPGSGGGAPPGSGGGMGPPGSGGGMGGMMPPNTQPQQQPAGPSVAWRSLKPDLKKMLDYLEQPKPAVLTFVAEGNIVADALRKNAAGNNLGIDLSKIPQQDSKDARAVGLALHAAQIDRATVTVAVDAASDAAAKEAETNLNQLLPLVALGFQLQYGIKLTVTSGPGAAQGNAPGGIGSMFPGGPGVMMPPGSGGGGPKVGGPGGGGAPPLTGEGWGQTFQFPGSGGGMGGMGPMRPGGTGGGMFPPGQGGFPGGGQQQPGEEEATSTIGVTRAGTIVAVRLNVKWDRTKLYDEVVDNAREMAVLAKATTEMTVVRPRIHELAEALKAYTTKGGAFPAGAHDRPATERFNNPWPPDQRISWMADVIRYLPQYAAEYGANADRYPLGIDPNKSWNDKENLKAARMLVPQLLAAKSPESQWWVHYPKVAPAVGATHYVGVAGLGLDAAEGAPAKKRGVFGYDKSASLAEITDGPQNTIAVLQGPGDFKTPWLAGGGSTVRGLSEQDGVRPFVCAEYKGKRGTYAIMANGDVRFIYEDIPNAQFLAMVTIAGEETIEKADLDKFAPLIKPERSELVTKPLPPKPEEKNGATPPKPAEVPVANEAKRAADLKQFGLAYHNFISQAGKPPAKVEDLQPYLDNAALTAAVKDGTYVIYWDVKLLQLVNGTSNTVLGYEKDVPTKGGLVLFADGSVKTLTADAFAKAAKPPGK